MTKKRDLPAMPDVLPPEGAGMPDMAADTAPADEAPGVAVFATADGSVRVEVRLQGGTLWLSQKQLAQLYGVTVSNINKHLKAIFDDGELVPEQTIEDYSIVATNGKRYIIHHYNLDVVLHVGYRVRSTVGTLFRAWATERLREYMVKGFTMNDDQLKYGDGYDAHFRELLDRIRDIRPRRSVFTSRCGISSRPPVWTMSRARTKRTCATSLPICRTACSMRSPGIRRRSSSSCGRMAPGRTWA